MSDTTDADLLAADRSEIAVASPRRRVVVLVASAFGLALVALYSVVARAAVPVRLETFSHDDLLFARLAASVLDGQWLGTFNSITLAKGPGYPLFLAGSYELGVPAKVAEQLVQVVAAALLAAGAARITGRRALGVMLFVLVVLDPAYLGGEAARLNRTGLYASASTGLLGGLLLTASLARGRAGPALIWHLGVVATGVATGASALLCVVTREERITLLPAAGAAALLALGLAGTSLRRPWRSAGASARRLLPVLVAGLLATATVALGVQALEDRNERVYGVPFVSDFTEGAFPELYSALAAVDVGERRRFVPISEAQRAAAYRASPAFATLEDELEGFSKRWVVSGCYVLDVCDDYAAGWMPWALRDAVIRSLPEARSAGAVQRLMSRAASEVAAGCGRSYACRPVVAAFLPDPADVPVRAFADAVARGTGKVLTYEMPGLRSDLGTDAQYATFGRVVRGLPADPRELALRPSVRPGWLDLHKTVYAFFTWLLVLPALVGLLWLRDRGQRRIQALAAVLLVACASRIALVALVDVTSFPAVETGYLLPAVDPAVALVALGCASLVLGLRPWYERRAASALRA